MIAVLWMAAGFVAGLVIGGLIVLITIGPSAEKLSGN